MALDPIWGIVGGLLAGILGGYVGNLLTHVSTKKIDRHQSKEDALLTLRFCVRELFDAWNLGPGRPPATFAAERTSAQQSLEQAWNNGRPSIGSEWHERLKPHMTAIRRAVGTGNAQRVRTACEGAIALLEEV